MNYFLTIISVNHYTSVTGCCILKIMWVSVTGCGIFIEDWGQTDC